MDLNEFVAELPDGTVLQPLKLTNCDQVFDSLNDVEAAADLIDPKCMNTYLIQALNGNLTSSLTKYHDILKTTMMRSFAGTRMPSEISSLNLLPRFRRRTPPITLIAPPSTYTHLKESQRAAEGTSANLFCRTSSRSATPRLSSRDDFQISQPSKVSPIPSPLSQPVIYTWVTQSILWTAHRCSYSWYRTRLLV